MSTNLDVSSDVAVDLARESLYRFLAAALSNPRRENVCLLFDRQSQGLVGEAAALLRNEVAETAIPLGFGEMPAESLNVEPLLGQLPETPDSMSLEYDRVFGFTPPRECPPFETEFYKSGEPFFCSQQMADIAGFYRAFGLEPANTFSGRPDYLVLELEFMAFVLLKKRQALAAAEQDPSLLQQVEVCDEAQRKFFRDHLAWWVPSFAIGLRRRAEQGFYFHLGQVLASFMPLERHRFGVAAPRLPMEAAAEEKPEEDPSCAGCDGAG